MARIQAAAIENLMNTIDDNEERKESLTSEVYSILLAMLVNEDIPSGTILNRRTVANQLGVSVAPILEAFNRLEWEGFLKTIPRKGTMVIVPSVTDVIENMIVREALEAQAARMINGKKIMDHLDGLMPLAIQLDSSLISDDRSNICLENEFHGSLMKLTGNKALITEHERLLNRRLFLSLHNKLLYTTKDQKMIDTHQHLLSQLTTEDPDLAEKAIRYHLGTSRISLERMLKNTEKYDTTE